MTTQRPVPDGFAEAAPGAAVYSLMVTFKASTDTVKRWLEEVGLLDAYINRKGNNPPPADWVEIAPSMPIHLLVTHYKVHRNTIRRWGLETGVTAKKCARVLYAERKALGLEPIPEPRPKKVFVHSRGNQNFQAPTVTDWSDAGQAAAFLRRKYSCVHRCDIRLADGSPDTWGDRRTPPLPDRGKGHWRVDGVGILNASEVVALAKKRGWRQ